MTGFTKSKWRIDKRELLQDTLRGFTHYYVIRNANIRHDYEDWGFSKEDAELIVKSAGMAKALHDQGFDAVRLIEALPEIMAALDLGLTHLELEGEFGDDQACELWGRVNSCRRDTRDKP